MEEQWKVQKLNVSSELRLDLWGRAEHRGDVSRIRSGRRAPPSFPTARQLLQFSYVVVPPSRSGEERRMCALGLASCRLEHLHTCLHTARCLWMGCEGHWAPSPTSCCWWLVVEPQGLGVLFVEIRYVSHAHNVQVFSSGFCRPQYPVPSPPGPELLALFFSCAHTYSRAASFEQNILWQRSWEKFCMWS